MFFIQPGIQVDVGAVTVQRDSAQVRLPVKEWSDSEMR